MGENSNFANDYGLEKFVGIRIYSTDTLGVFGQVKFFPSDFLVEEITPNGDILRIEASDSSHYRNDEKNVKFTTFTLVKRNMDTILAARQIAKEINIPFNEITWAGLKDNRAITAQRMCIRGNYIKNLSDLQLDNMKIRDIRSSKHSFSIGNLWGNHFSILIRYIGDKNTYKTHDKYGNLKLNSLPINQIYDEEIEIPITDSSDFDIQSQDATKNNEEVEMRDSQILITQNVDYSLVNQIINETTQQIHERGFPNFFGLQRFGSYRPNSFIVGKLMFLKRYKDAVEEFVMKDYPKEIDIVRKCRQELYLTQDFKKALMDFPQSLYYERIIIDYLINHPEKYLDALKHLPQPLIQLLLSSYQSYLFNIAISRRKEQENEFHMPKKGDKIALLYEEKGPPTPVMYTYGKFYDVHLDKMLKNERASIVCPILGFDSDLKDTFFGKIYEDLLTQEEFRLEYFKNEDFPNMIYRGTYRPITVKPKNLTATLIDGDKKDQPKILKLDFSLPKGTYATMLIREYLKNV